MIIKIIQLSGNTYFWVLQAPDKVLARSSNIDEKEIIEKEAEQVASELGLDLWQSERETNDR